MKNDSTIKVFNLFDICNPKQWKTISTKDLTKSGYPIYGANGKIGFYYKYNHVEPTLLITCRGATCGSLIISEPKSYINGNAMSLDNLSKGVEIKYLYYYLLHRGFKDSISGSAQPQITRQGLQKINIPVPPLDAQKHIVKGLDKAYFLRNKRKRSTQLLDEYLKSVFLEMFGGLLENKNITIGEALLHKILLLHKDGNHGSNYPKKEEFGLKGVPFITAKSIDESGHLIQSKIEYLSEKKANKLTIGWINTDDILLAHNATVGRVGYYPGTFEKALIGTSLTTFRANKEFINPHYLFEYLRSDYFQKQLFKGMGQSTRNQVPITAQRNLKLVVPPLSLQKQFSEIVEKSEKIKQKMFVQSEEMEKQFQALMQKAFKGGI